MTIEERIERIERASKAYADAWFASYGHDHGEVTMTQSMHAFVNVMLGPDVSAELSAT